MSSPALPVPVRRTALVLLPLLLLGGCKMEVLFPAGDVARQQAHLLMLATVLMLLIIIPVLALTALFAWHYRQGNTAATYRPDWDHSIALELVIWSMPLLIIIALGALTWISTHTLDPYRRLGRISASQPIAAGVPPLEIDVVALDWKWLFIYPAQNIATVNQLVLPTNREIRFRLTASAVMNSFFIPTLAGQVYAMPGMETKLHAVLNRVGRYEGFSANYSGAGFSDMHFAVTGLDADAFARWLTEKADHGELDRAAYLTLAKPSEDVAPMRWSAVAPGLFDRAVNRCVAEESPCISDMMQHEADAHRRGMTMQPAAVPDAGHGAHADMPLCPAPAREDAAGTPAPLSPRASRG